MYQCNIDEALVSDLTAYETFTGFFTRKLKPGVRGIEENAAIVSIFSQ